MARYSLLAPFNTNEPTIYFQPHSRHNPPISATAFWLKEQEAQLMLTTGSTRLAVSRGQQTWYFGSIATFR